MTPFYLLPRDRPSGGHEATSPAAPQTKLLGGGTNLHRPHENGRRNARAARGHHPPALAKIEELPDGRASASARSSRNSDLAEHPLIVERYPVLSQALLAGASRSCATWPPPAATCSSARVVIISTTRRSRVQQTPARQRVRRAGRLQPHPRDPGHERALHRHPPERHVRGPGRAGRRGARAGAEGRTGDPLRGVSPPARRASRVDTNLQPDELITAVDLPARRGRRIRIT